MELCGEVKCQGSIEGVILGVVGKTIYPGVRDNEKLYNGPESVAWWKEHLAERDNGRPTSEAGHLDR